MLAVNEQTLDTAWVRVELVAMLLAWQPQSPWARQSSSVRRLRTPLLPCGTRHSCGTRHPHTLSVRGPGGLRMVELSSSRHAGRPPSSPPAVWMHRHRQRGLIGRQWCSLEWYGLWWHGRCCWRLLEHDVEMTLTLTLYAGKCTLMHRTRMQPT